MSSAKYRIMWCTTLNPFGATMQEEVDDLHSVITWCINFRNKQCERMSAGYSVYVIGEDGGNAETLLNWQHDGKNTFGFLRDPDNPSWYFAADPYATIPAPDLEFTPDEFAALYAPML